MGAAPTRCTACPVSRSARPGGSPRQAAQRLEVPRTTLHAGRAWQPRRDAWPQVVVFFASGPGLAFLHRLGLAFHVVCGEMGACGMRLVCLGLAVTGRKRLVVAAAGTQPQVHCRVVEAIVVYRRDARALGARDAAQRPHADAG